MSSELRGGSIDLMEGTLERASEWVRGRGLNTRSEKESI